MMLDVSAGSSLQQHRHGLVLCDFAREETIDAQGQHNVRGSLHVASAVSFVVRLVRCGQMFVYVETFVEALRDEVL